MVMGLVWVTDTYDGYLVVALTRVDSGGMTIPSVENAEEQIRK